MLREIDFLVQILLSIVVEAFRSFNDELIAVTTDSSASVLSWHTD